MITWARRHRTRLKSLGLRLCFGLCLCFWIPGILHLLQVALPSSNLFISLRASRVWLLQEECLFKNIVVCICVCMMWVRVCVHVCECRWTFQGQRTTSSVGPHLPPWLTQSLFGHGVHQAELFPVSTSWFVLSPPISCWRVEQYRYVL